MKEPNWLLDDIVTLIHQKLLAEHGGGQGLRDGNLLASALVKPKQKFNYEPNTSIFELAAAYSFGIAKNHPFVDGNKRTAFTLGVLFIELNGFQFMAPEPEAAVTFEALADSKIDELELAAWFMRYSSNT